MLRYYQQDAVAAVYKYLATKKTNPCVEMPVGSGKSWVLGQIAADTVSRGSRVIIVAGARELLEQNAEKVRLVKPGIDLGIYSAGLSRRDTANSVIVAGVQSVYNKIELLGPRDICIIDECHLIPPEGDGMYRSLIAGLRKMNPEMRLIGFTATPYRLQGGMICKAENILNEICYSIGLKELIEKGYLSELVTKSAAESADTSRLQVRAGEFVADDVERTMNDQTLVARSCKELVSQTASRKSVLVFCSSIAHCEAVAKAIKFHSGEECAIVTGNTPGLERAEILTRFRMNSIRYLLNVDCLTTGFDAPNIDAIALMRPTMSPGLLMQMCGRGTRLSPETGKKNCLILDFGSNFTRLGPLDALHPPGDREESGDRPQVGTVPKRSQVGTVPNRQERQLKIDSISSKIDPISAKSTRIEDIPVMATYYFAWEKKANGRHSRTLRVNYRTADGRVFSQWLCPEHFGYARSCFVDWFKARRKSKTLAVPRNVTEFLILANSGYIRQTATIRVRSAHGGSSYPEIISSTALL